MGTPPKEFNVQIDTGSDILWVNCNTCSNCPQSSQLGVRFFQFKFDFGAYCVELLVIMHTCGATMGSEHFFIRI